MLANRAWSLPVVPSGVALTFVHPADRRHQVAGKRMGKAG
jgi:hypothetical protein